MTPTFCIGATQHNFIAGLHNEGIQMWKRNLVLGVGSLRVETPKLHECDFAGKVPPVSKRTRAKSARGPETHATADLEAGATYM
jgi:hypothetical protein